MKNYQRHYNSTFKFNLINSLVFRIMGRHLWGLSKQLLLIITTARNYEDYFFVYHGIQVRMIAISTMANITSLK